MADNYDTVKMDTKKLFMTKDIRAIIINIIISFCIGGRGAV